MHGEVRLCFKSENYFNQAAILKIKIFFYFFFINLLIYLFQYSKYFDNVEIQFTNKLTNKFA